MQNKDIYIKDLNALEKFAFDFAKELSEQQKAIVYLHGDLGAGKTTLTQYIIGFLGCTDRVKSPTYSLLESYETDTHKIYHLDLYRLQDPEELYFMGIADLFETDALFFIEWPERIDSLNVRADIEIALRLEKDHPDSRFLTLNQKEKLV